MVQVVEGQQGGADEALQVSGVSETGHLVRGFLYAFLFELDVLLVGIIIWECVT